MKKALIIAGGVLVAVVAAAMIYAATQKPTWNVKVAATVPAPASALYPAVASLKRWEIWTPWGKARDPGARYTFTGPESGVGAEMAWQGEELGEGRLRIIEAEAPRRVIYNLWFEDSPTPGTGSLTFDENPDGKTTTVTWEDNGDASNLLFRLMVPIIEKAVAKDFATGLANMTKAVQDGRIAVPAAQPEAPTSGGTAASPAQAATPGGDTPGP